MPWIEAVLRGRQVFARARADGTLQNEGGRVEIRYGARDGRAYRAAVQNLVLPSATTLHPDDVCGSATPVATNSATGLARVAKPVAMSAPHPTSAEAWEAFTDGACWGNPGPAGSGIVLVSPDGKMHEGWEYLGEATNNVAELTAILRALEWIPQQARAIVVHTDSQYAIGVLQKGWKAKANQDLVARAKKLVVGRGARLVYVPGHQGVALNERADTLAGDAIRTRATQRAL
ncbi:MAG: reverse transcriptase-like protein [Myxococcota bacterium]|nr:reverse transcriptase-like protein [Myxococcota bacterium]